MTYLDLGPLLSTCLSLVSKGKYRGMRVVYLDGSVFSQAIQVAAALLRFLYKKLHGICDHEILLINTQDAALIVGIVRIKEQR